MTKKLERILQDLKKINAETYYHSLRVKKLTIEMIDITYKNGLTNYSEAEIDMICKGAILHDIGKLYISNYIMTKENALTDEEKNLIKEHAEKGFKAIESELNDDEYEIISNIVLNHHERIDGRGYKGMIDVPLYVQIVSVCDAYDALSSDRVYRYRLTKKSAIDNMREDACGKFDYKLLDFMEMISSAEGSLIPQ